MFDLFFVSYEEPNADLNWEKLKERFPHARRIHGIKGIKEAHYACAKQSFTKMFWTVDGDTIVDNTWLFDYVPPAWDLPYLHLWYSRNPVNDLSYGYGAIKLWPRNRVLDHKGSWLDFTTSVGNIKIIDQTIATTEFNTSPYESWKSAFRESIKLCENISKNENDEESRDRLRNWLTVANDSPYADSAIKGAQHALIWYQDNKEFLQEINDFNRLKEIYSMMIKE